MDILYNNQPADSEHVIKVDKTSFGYVVTYKNGNKIIFTGSYNNKSAAIRIAKRLSKQARQNSENIWLCLNDLPGK